LEALEADRLTCPNSNIHYLLGTARHECNRTEHDNSEQVNFTVYMGEAFH